MKKLVSILLFAIIGLSLSAQQMGPNLSWDSSTHDFGEINEADGKVTHKFTFTNTGNEPLVLTNVRPSCGCTSSDYTKEPIIPGSKGYVSATYNPARRPGKFSKSITITSNTEPATSSIRFTGNVIAKPKTKRDVYPRSMGDLWLETNQISLMKVSQNETKEGSLNVYNDSDKDLTITFRNVPNHITIKAVPSMLKPKTEGKLIVTYDAQKKNDWGFLMDRITIAVNGNTDQNKNRISVSATIEEDFSQLSKEELDNSARINFDSKVFNFGTIKQGEKIPYSFKFTNTGKSDLMIRKIKTTCGCTVANSDKEIIKAGESSELKVVFNSAGKSNRQNKSITVISNDPTQSQVTLRVTGTVLKPGQTESVDK
ncbi:MAG: DUF1573 domain-containing protein [Salinivirgaceae bacterium]|nr:DUF1573 domain-containing protein [Salinivirgaceae bacterium]